MSIFFFKLNVCINQSFITHAGEKYVSVTLSENCEV